MRRKSFYWIIALTFIFNHITLSEQGLYTRHEARADGISGNIINPFIPLNKPLDERLPKQAANAIRTTFAFTTRLDGTDACKDYFNIIFGWNDDLTMDFLNIGLKVLQDSLNLSPLSRWKTENTGVDKIKEIFLLQAKYPSYKFGLAFAHKYGVLIIEEKAGLEVDALPYSISEEWMEARSEHNLDTNNNPILIRYFALESKSVIPGDAEAARVLLGTDQRQHAKFQAQVYYLVFFDPPVFNHIVTIDLQAFKGSKDLLPKNLHAVNINNDAMKIWGNKINDDIVKLYNDYFQQISKKGLSLGPIGSATLKRFQTTKPGNKPEQNLAAECESVLLDKAKMEDKK